MITESNKRNTSLDKQKQYPYTLSVKKDVLINSTTESAFAVVAPHAILSAVTAQRGHLEWIMVFLLPGSMFTCVAAYFSDRTVRNNRQNGKGGVRMNSDLNLTIATVPYDRVEALRFGTVRPDGIALDYKTVIPAHDIFYAMVEREAYDVSEMSLAYSLMRLAAGDAPFVAVPVFPSRVFRHGNIFVNRKAGIVKPRDLEGRRVGIQEFRQTALIWVRGMLRDDHGVNTDSIRWVEGGVNEPQRNSSTDMKPKRAYHMEALAGKSLSDALAAGELDAVIAAMTPESLQTSDDVVRLFPDYRVMEHDYFRRTGIFPIMHTLVIRKKLYEANPWIAASLFRAFEAAKAAAAKRMRYNGALVYMMPWLRSDMEEMDAVFRGDAWPYGLEANLGPLDTFLRYLVEDGFLPRKPRLDDLFVPITG